MLPVIREQLPVLWSRCSEQSPNEYL